MRRNDNKNYNIFKFLGAVVIFIVIFMLVFKVYGVSYEKYQINKKITILDDAMNALNGRGDDLKALMMKLENKDYIEKEARKKLNFQKPGENSVIITKKGGVGVGSGAIMKDDRLAPQGATIDVNPKLWYSIFFGE